MASLWKIDVSCTFLFILQMSFPLEEAILFRNKVLLEEKENRKPRVNSILAQSLTLEQVEKKLRYSIQTRPTEDHHYVLVLNVVTNDWGTKDYALLREEVYEALEKKYGEAFFGAKFCRENVGNQSIGFAIHMNLNPET